MMAGINGIPPALHPRGRSGQDTSTEGRDARDDRPTTGNDHAGSRGGLGSDVGRERGDRHAAALRDAFRTAVAQTTAAPAPTPERDPADTGGDAETTEGGFVIPPLPLPGLSPGAAPAATAEPALPAERAAAVEALAVKLEGELDMALRVSARKLGGGVEVRLSLDSAKLGLSGVTVTMRGPELSVSLTAASGLGAEAFAASAQALAASLTQRFPRKIVRVGRAAPAETAETPTITDIFAGRC